MANDVYQLIIRGTCSGEFWETVQHYQAHAAMATDPVTACSHLIAAFQNTVEGSLQDLLAADNAILGYSAKRVNNGGSPTVMLPIAPILGNVAGTSATAAVAYLIVSEYSFSGKFRTGRWFIPGIPETNLVGNGYTAGAIADVGTLVGVNSTIANGGDTFDWGVWSRTHTAFFLPTYAHLSSKVGIQRRRLLPV